MIGNKIIQKEERAKFGLQHISFRITLVQYKVIKINKAHKISKLGSVIKKK